MDVDVDDDDDDDGGAVLVGVSSSGATHALAKGGSDL